MRIRRGSIAIKRRKRLLKTATGYIGSGSRLFRTSKQRVEKALAFGYQHRRLKKRVFRKLWITRINGWCRFHLGLNYNQFLFALKKKNVMINRKWLSQLLLLDDPLQSFKENAYPM